MSRKRRGRRQVLVLPCSVEKIKEQVGGSGTVWFFSLAAMADGGVDQGEEVLDFQMFTPHPNPLPVWRGEGVRHIIRHYRNRIV